MKIFSIGKLLSSFFIYSTAYANTAHVNVLNCPNAEDKDFLTLETSLDKSTPISLRGQITFGNFSIALREIDVTAVKSAQLATGDDGYQIELLRADDPNSSLGNIVIFPTEEGHDISVSIHPNTEAKLYTFKNAASCSLNHRYLDKLVDSVANPPPYGK